MGTIIPLGVNTIFKEVIMRYLLYFNNLKTGWVKSFNRLDAAYKLYDQMKAGYPRNTHVEIFDAWTKKTVAKYEY